MLTVKAWILISILVSADGIITSRVLGQYPLTRAGVISCTDDRDDLDFKLTSEDGEQRTCVVINVLGVTQDD